MGEASKLVAIVFDEETRSSQLMGGASVGVTDAGHIKVGEDPELALLAWKEIQAKAKEADVELGDAVIVHKKWDGQTNIKQMKELTPGKGAGRGTFWGFLVGLILGGPIAGALFGMGIGALWGRASDKGIDNEFIKNVASAMRPSRSAILMLIPEDHYEGAITYLRSFEADIYEADLSKEAEEAMTKAAEDEAIARAVEDEFAVE